MWRSQGVGARFGPSKRIQELARHKTSKAVWATTPRPPQGGVSPGNGPHKYIEPEAAAEGERPRPRCPLLQPPLLRGPDSSPLVPHHKLPDETPQILCAPVSFLRLSHDQTQMWRVNSSAKPLLSVSEPIWPVSAAALQALPSARIRQLARHRVERHVREAGCRGGKEEEEEEGERSFRKSRHPSSAASQHQLIVRLSTPRTRSSKEARSPHSSSCEPNCPIWHVDPRTATAPVSPRVLQLSRPKRNHPDFLGNRQSSQSFVSAASKTATASQRVLCLALPRLKQSDICRNLGRPEEPVWRVSNSAKRATASPRLRVLAAPKPLSKDYLPPREPEWTRWNRS